jgi:ribosomal-protein-alanine N-acetyltransferase
MNASTKTALPLQPPISQQAITADDLDEVLAIEAAAYRFPWTRGNFADSLAAGYLAEKRVDALGRCIGYVVAMPGHLETHLLNLAVAPAYQRQGHGRSMLARLCQQARLRGDHKLWLEVRRGNSSARRMYQRCGFEQVGLRKGYYPALLGQREDAVVMSLDLDLGGGAEGLPKAGGHALD